MFLCYQFVQDYFRLYFCVINLYMIILIYFSGYQFIHDYFGLYFWVINVYTIIFVHTSVLTMCT